jgi:hypothetical protein
MSKGGGMSKGCKLQLGEGGGSGNVNSGTVSVDKQEGWERGGGRIWGTCHDYISKGLESFDLFLQGGLLLYTCCGHPGCAHSTFV